MAYQGYKFFGVDLTFADADTEQKETLGQRAESPDGKVFVYCEAGASVTAGNVVTTKIGETNAPYVIEHCDAATEQPIGIACNTASDGEYLWVQVKGKYASANVATSTAAGAMIIGSSTAGRGAAVANNADEVVIPFAQVLVEAASNAANINIMSPF